MVMMIAKGTTLNQDIATVMTPVAQIFSLSGPDEQAETTEFDRFDNTGRAIPMEPTGRSVAGTYQFSLFLDLALAGHKALLAKIKSPAKHDWSLVYSDATEWDLVGVLKGPSVSIALAEGVKADFSIELSEAIDYPTT